MAVLITGAGLVGSLAARHLLEDYGEQPVLYDVAFPMDNLKEWLPLDKVVLVRGDVNDLSDLVGALQRHKIQRVIHSAAFLTWMVRERPYAGVRINLMGTLSVLEAARLAGAQRVVLCSSNTVTLGLKGTQPYDAMPEDFSLRAISDYPPSVYASMKLAAEWLGHNYCADYGVDFAAVRFGGVFGPWHGTPSGGPSQTMKLLIENTWRGEAVPISSSELTRAMDYVYADDAARGAVQAAMAARLPQPVYNIAMGRNFTIPQIVEVIEEYTGRKVELDVREAPSVSGYTDSQVPPADCARARADLGWELKFPMNQAVRDYVGWLGRH
jgi:UDP-glucose 4-epimerase